MTRNGDTDGQRHVNIETSVRITLTDEVSEPLARIGEEYKRLQAVLRESIGDRKQDQEERPWLTNLRTDTDTWGLRKGP